VAGDRQVILGVVDGGPHPVRSVSIGALLVVLTTAALWRRHIVCAWLRRGWPVAAQAIFDLLLEARERTLGASHPDTPATRERRAVARRAAGR
jgi:hypothetical protein